MYPIWTNLQQAHWRATWKVDVKPDMPVDSSLVAVYVYNQLVLFKYANLLNCQLHTASLDHMAFPEMDP